MDEKEKETETETVTFSRRHKVRMNRIFREYGGMKRIPYPEVDTLFERLRSKVVRAFFHKK